LTNLERMRAAAAGREAAKPRPAPAIVKTVLQAKPVPASVASQQGLPQRQRAQVPRLPDGSAYELRYSARSEVDGEWAGVLTVPSECGPLVFKTTAFTLFAVAVKLDRIFRRHLAGISQPKPAAAATPEATP
jgi:hypothetical protein